MKTKPLPSEALFRDWPAYDGVSLHMAMNDSAATLIEWVLHHRLVGFGKITVYGDGANSEATNLAEALAGAGLIRFCPTDTPGAAAARARAEAAMAQALAEDTEGKTEFTLWLDPEDFVLVTTGKGGLNDLFSAVKKKKPDLISLSSQFVGGDGELRYADKPLPQRFRRGTGTGKDGPVLATPLRTFFRPGVAAAIRAARPRLKPKYRNGKEKCLWLDGSGDNVTERYLKNGWTANRQAPGFGLARVFSYYAQDRETWLLRNIGTAQVLPFITPDSLKASIAQYFRLNFAYAPITALDEMSRHCDGVREQLFAAMPKIAKAHQAAVDEFSGRMEQLLTSQHPTAREAIGKFLSGQRPEGGMFNWPVPLGVETTRPPLSEADSPWSTTLTARETEPDEEAMFREPDNDGVQEPVAASTGGSAVSPAPGWLSDLRLSGQSHGFYHSMPNYACTYAARSQEHLLISFDNLASIGENPVNRQPWGYDFVRKAGWSHLGVMSFVPGWYRDKTLHHYLLSLRDSGFFREFGKVTLFGTSMGAYAACAFASLAPGCTVAAFSPQSTLDSRLVPWESRYPSGRRADWDGAFRDAAVEMQTAERGWLFYDPRMALDVRHINRFASGNISRVPLRNADHKTALVLRNGKVLSEVMRSIVLGEATTESLLQLYRNCRTTDFYLENLRARTPPARLPWLKRAISAVDRKRGKG